MHPHQLLWLTLGGLTSLPSLSAELGLDYLDYQTTSPHPLIQVTAQGNQFGQASSDAIQFRGQGRAKCNTGYRVMYLGQTLSPDNNGNATYASKKEVENPHAKNMTWSSDWKDLSLDWAPNAAWRQAAVQACNQRLQQRLEQGESYAQIRAQAFDVLIPKEIWSGLHMFCADYGITGGTHHVYRQHPVLAHCQASSLPPAQPQQPTPGQIAAKLQLQAATLQAPQPHYQGPCPGQMAFVARIHSNGAAGQVQYRFLVNGQAITGFVPLALPAGQALFELPYQLQVNAPKPMPEPAPLQIKPANPQAGPMLQVQPGQKLSFEVKSNDQKLSAEAAYSVQCQAPQGLLPPSQPQSQPDLSAQPPVSVGMQSTHWGAELQLHASDASATSPHGCQYRLAYTATNLGTGPATTTHARLRLNDNAVLHQHQGLALAAQASEKVDGLIILPAGRHLLSLSLDDDQAMDESQEGNNRFRLWVTAPPSCSPSDRPRPQTTR